MKNATLAQGNQMLNLILQKQTPSEQLQRLMESGLFSDLLEATLENDIDRNAFRSLIGLKPINAFAVTVNYDLSVENAVKAGKYDWSNSDITTKNFPPKRKGKAGIELTLFHFNRSMESDEVVREFDKQGLRPAELPELLSFGAKYPDIQRDFPVVALGSFWRRPFGRRRCAYLYGHGFRRSLCLHWLAFGWHDDYRFAAVRK